jgi:lipoprotein-releasing system ATP-binding protein
VQATFSVAFFAYRLFPQELNMTDAAQIDESGPLLRVEDLCKEFPSGNGTLTLFRNLNLTVGTGEMVAIIGESGSGKSTLLHMLAALDRPTSGAVYFGSTLLGKLTAGQAAAFRNREIGYVWQMHYLLPEFTALENAAMPLLARNLPKNEAFTAASRLLNEVGLAARAGHRAGELSGGEQQRVAFARALVTGPRLLLADEPTGSLDASTADSVFDVLTHLHAAHQLTSVLVTHNLDLARRCGRMLRLRNGQLQEVPAAGKQPDQTPPESVTGTGTSNRQSSCVRVPAPDPA